MSKRLTFSWRNPILEWKHKSFNFSMTGDTVYRWTDADRLQNPNYWLIDSFICLLLPEEICTLICVRTRLPIGILRPPTWSRRLFIFRNYYILFITFGSRNIGDLPVRSATPASNPMPIDMNMSSHTFYYLESGILLVSKVFVPVFVRMSLSFALCSQLVHSSWLTGFKNSLAPNWFQLISNWFHYFALKFRSQFSVRHNLVAIQTPADSHTDHRIKRVARLVELFSKSSLTFCTTFTLIKTEIFPLFISF